MIAQAIHAVSDRHSNGGSLRDASAQYLRFSFCLDPQAKQITAPLRPALLQFIRRIYIYLYIFFEFFRETCQFDLGKIFDALLALWPCPCDRQQLLPHISGVSYSCCWCITLWGHCRLRCIALPVRPYDMVDVGAGTRRLYDVQCNRDSTYISWYNI